MKRLLSPPVLANIQLVNAPTGAQLSTSSLPVSVVGPEAQVTRLTGSEVSVQVDLSNFQDRTGTVEVPATVTLTGRCGRFLLGGGRVYRVGQFQRKYSPGSSCPYFYRGGG